MLSFSGLNLGWRYEQTIYQAACSYASIGNFLWVFERKLIFQTPKTWHRQAVNDAKDKEMSFFSGGKKHYWIKKEHVILLDVRSM